MKIQSRFNEPKEVEDAEYDDVNGWTRRHSFIGLGLVASRCLFSITRALITPLVLLILFTDKWTRINVAM